MQQVVAGESKLQTQDWVLIPEDTPRAALSFPADYFHVGEQLVATSASPWSTIPLYYDGPVPLRRQPESQERVQLLRVMRELVPRLQRAPAP